MIFQMPLLIKEESYHYQYYESTDNLRNTMRNTLYYMNPT